jgi:DNA-directed RNA polymerase subunit RPC12/RpoP
MMFEVKFYCLLCKKHFESEEWEESKFKRYHSTIKAAKVDCPTCGRQVKRPLSRRQWHELRYGKV